MERSTVTLALACKSLRKGILIAIDPHHGTFTHKSTNIDSSLSKLQQNLKANKVQKYVKIRQGTSNRLHRQFDKESIGLIFIDASHEYADVKNDYEKWSNKIRWGG